VRELIWELSLPEPAQAMKAPIPGAGTDMGAFIAWAGSGLYTMYIGLWDAGTGQAVWQATTNSATTGSESGDTKALADFVVDTLQAKGLL